MKPRRNLRISALALVGIVALATVGWIAASGIRSPAQIAADTAAPAPSAISVPVERRELATEVIVRGTVRYGAPLPVTLPTSSLKTGSPVISRAPRPGRRLRERDVALSVSGRPVIVLQGARPMNRDLAPGARGADVMQLERALIRAGVGGGRVDGRYDAATAAGVAALYRRAGVNPFGVTDSQAEKLATAAAAVGSAEDRTLQMRLALRTARRGATPAEINQARLDAAAASEALPPARLAIASASTKVAEAAAARDTARRQMRGGDTAAQREMVTATADVATRQAAVNEALTTQAEAQRAFDLARTSPDTPAADLESLRVALRKAIDQVPITRADLSFAERAVGAVRATLTEAFDKALDDANRATRERRLAEAELREARAALATLERKRRLAAVRVRILRAPANVAVEREIVAAAAAEERRTRAERDRIAATLGVQVPADEILFVPTVPVRVDSVTARPGMPATGDLITVTNSRLAIDSSLSVGDAKLVRRGMRVRIEEPDLRVTLNGRVLLVADRPGTNNVDPGRTYLEVAPGAAPASLVGTSVKLSIAVKATRGRVLAVPVSALSVAADGSSRVQVDRGRGRLRYVAVEPGLAAQGFVEVRPKRDGALKAGDLVVVGARAAAAARRAPANVAITPVPGGGASTTPAVPEPSAASGAGSAPAAPATTAPAAPTTTAPAAPDPGAPRVP